MYHDYYIVVVGWSILDKALDEQHWNELIKSIVAKKCIPIIGAGSSQQWIPQKSFLDSWNQNYSHLSDFEIFLDSLSLYPYHLF